MTDMAPFFTDVELCQTNLQRQYLTERTIHWTIFHFINTCQDSLFA